MSSDQFLAIAEPADALLRDRGSKFYAYAFPATSIEDIQQKIAELQKLHPTACHHCWASRIGWPEVEERAQDDGEPSHSAGTPILHAIQGAGLSQSAVVVTRIFGGTKLGVPGLIASYRGAAELALAEAKTCMYTLQSEVTLTLPYEDIGAVELLTQQTQSKIRSQDFAHDVTTVIQFEMSRRGEIAKRLENLHRISVEWSDESTFAS